MWSNDSSEQSSCVRVVKRCPNYDGGRGRIGYGGIAK